MKTHEDSTQTDRLLERVAAGDAKALNGLFSSHRRYLRTLVDLRMEGELRGRVDPSDVVQQTQLVASQRLADFLDRRPTSFRIWLRRKALEHLVDVRRHHLNAAKRTVRREVTLSDCSSLALVRGLPVESPSRQVTRKERAQQVRLAVLAMREADREILLLRHVEALSNAEADQLLGEVANEYFDQVARGDQPDVEAYARRYPQIADLIRDTFPAVSLLEEPTESRECRTL